MRSPKAWAKTLLLLAILSLYWLVLLPDSQGTEAWPVRYNRPGNDWDQARALAVDYQGNVYATGYSNGGDSSDDYTTIKYSP